MRFSTPADLLYPILCLSQIVSSSPIAEPEGNANLVPRAAPNLWLAGDSTMAYREAGSPMQGWGAYLQYSFPSSKFVVQNKAVPGRSARSYWREGRFQNIANYVKAGDWVVLEFGHNDIEPLTPNDTGRPPCPGLGNEKCYSTFNGVNETVYTFSKYLKTATQLYLAKGAKVIIGSSTPANPWRTGTFTWAYNQPFFYYSWIAAVQAGGTSKGVYFVPHGYYAALALKNLGASTTNAGYYDTRHPRPELADVFAQSFVFGLKCGSSELASSIVNSTASMPKYLGSCKTFNSTMPL